jgi:hypothetical protein
MNPERPSIIKNSWAGNLINDSNCRSVVARSSKKNKIAIPLGKSTKT